MPTFEDGLRLSDLSYYHGTTDAILDLIEDEGLTPRGDRDPAYGRTSGAEPGNPNYVYLTVMRDMAHFAARDAAAAYGGNPIVLEVSDLDERNLVSDEDSREPTAEMSLARLGSLAHVGAIPPEKISLYEILENRNWRRV